MAPELFLGAPYSFEVDLWAMAVMLHELLTGYSIGRPMEIAHDELPDADACDLLARMLTPTRESRLGFGADGHEHIRAHAYFASIDWAAVLSKEVAPPIDVGRLTVDTMGVARGERDGLGLSRRRAASSQ